MSKVEPVSYRMCLEILFPGFLLLALFFIILVDCCNPGCPWTFAKMSTSFIHFIPYFILQSI